MGLSEDNADRFKEDKLPDNLGEPHNGHESGCPPEPERPEVPSIDSVDMQVPGDHWAVEVVPGQVSDAVNRISCAFDLLLAAAARPR